MADDDFWAEALGVKYAKVSCVNPFLYVYFGFYAGPHLDNVLLKPNFLTFLAFIRMVLALVLII